jgi:hypothetical protein
VSGSANVDPTDAPFDVIKFGRTRDASDTAEVVASAEAGATW